MPHAVSNPSCARAPLLIGTLQFVAIPTQEQVYPEWLEGEWEVDGQFAGFELPVKEISKKQLMADKEIPGSDSFAPVRSSNYVRV